MPGNFIKATDIDIEILLSSLDVTRREVDHSHRRQKIVEAIASAAPDLVCIVENVELYDDSKNEDGESELTKGVLLALKAIVDFAQIANEEFDVRNEATADYLSELEAQDLETVFEDALDTYADAAADDTAKLYTYVRDHLASRYPGLIQFIPTIASEQMHRSKDFRNGMWLGAIQLALAIDAMATHDDDGKLPSQMNGTLNARLVDPDEF